MTLPEPQIIRAAVTYRGQLAVLSIFRTCWQSEGSALFEMIDATGTANTLLDALMSQVVRNGSALGLDSFLPQGDQN